VRMSEKSFGPAASCTDLEEVVRVHRDIVGAGAKAAVAAYGMLVSARSAPEGAYYADALEVLNHLGRAKARLDAETCHTKPTILVTAGILAKAQEFVDETTIACTEWPTSQEVVAAVTDAVSEYAFAGPWKRHVYGNQGQVVGIEDVPFDS
jgi:methylthioribose-1-phosphate isomerase